MRTSTLLSIVSSLALAACEERPRLPESNAKAVEAAGEDVAKAEKKLDRADQPKEVMQAGKELTTSAVDFQKRRDAAVQAVVDTLAAVDPEIRYLYDTRTQTEFQDVAKEKEVDAAIQDLVTSRAQLESTLEQMRKATPETWAPLEQRVDELTKRIREARRHARDLLF